MSDDSTYIHRVKHSPRPCGLWVFYASLGLFTLRLARFITPGLARTDRTSGANEPGLGIYASLDPVDIENFSHAG